MTGPSNPHLADPILRPFLSPNFSPIDYLNTHLPSPTPSTTKSQQSTPSLSTLATQTQSHISSLNTQLVRLSNTLTDLTDDILRTNTRLSYEVELLRGEAFALAETLSTRGPLNNSIRRFVHNGFEPTDSNADPAAQTNGQVHADASEANPAEPPALAKLKTLHKVRTQLQRVIQIFNLALSFPLPPSLLSTPASNIVSLQPPNQDPDLESKAQSALANLKSEVVDLMRAGNADGAREKVRALREVCAVWKGTREEKARGKWVEGLEVLVGIREDEKEVERAREREREREKQKGRREQSLGRAAVGAGAGTETQSRSGTPGIGVGSGFLRRLRDEIYLDSS